MSDKKSKLIDVKILREYFFTRFFFLFSVLAKNILLGKIFFQYDAYMRFYNEHNFVLNL
jgi:hypothetical protein